MCWNLFYKLASFSTAWSPDELCDVLLLFKQIQLDPNFKNNYKELARRMTDSGWARDNNQCCQQVHIMYSCKGNFSLSVCEQIICCVKIQIDRLKKRYDVMQNASKKTGSVLYFEPLRVELNDCFGALKDVTPDAVYSNCRGLDENDGDSQEGGGLDTPKPSTSKESGENATTSKKKRSKSNNCNIYYFTLATSCT